MRVLALVVVAALALGGCADPATDTADTAAAPASDAATAAPSEPAEAMTDAADDEAGQTVAVDSSDLGEILVDGEGRTLYLFTPDEQGESTCYDECETNWPPLATPVEAGEGADAALLGEVEREDGTSQVTYNDWPLYYFAADTQAGDINGQGVSDVWFVVNAAGEPVKEAGGDEGARDY